ncbi:MAG: hypothetical protein AMXMBFR33_39680 [Candidatus Xenobia bacterium]
MWRGGGYGLLLAGLLTLACLAEPQVCEVRVLTTPPGASVSINGIIGEQGRSGEKPFHVTLPDTEMVMFEFMLDGYQPDALEVSRSRLLQAEKPVTVPLNKRPLRLEPSSPLARIYFYRYQLGVLLALASITAVGYLRFLRVNQRERRLQDLIATAEPSSLTGTRLGSYRLFETLGRGGMGRVYRALPKDTLDPDRAVAVKIMFQGQELDPELSQRFRREVKMCFELDHTNIVRLCDWGEQDGLIYLAMELVDGGTLRDRIPVGGLPLSEAAAILEPLSQALAHAHSRGVVHRDLKPENVMFTRGGQLKLMDFGLGKKNDSTNLTQSGAILGTPAYMAPEQIQGAGFEPSIDQYALGVIAYELLTGQTPFTNADPLQLVFQHVGENAPAPSTLRPALSPEVDQVVLRILSKSPEHRYASVAEAGRALVEALR